MNRILLTGSGGGATTGILNSLKQSPQKYFTVGVEAKAENIFFSLTDKTYLIPPASSNQYILAINKIVDKEKIDLIWVQPQIEVQTISKNRNLLHAKVFLPSEETVEDCYDKYKTLINLEKKKIPTPKTILIKTRKDILESFKVLGEKIWLREIKGVAGKGAFLASNEKQAYFWLEFNNGYGNFTASEYLSGPGYGCDMLFNNGELIFSQAKERISYMMSKASIVGVTGTTGILRTMDDSSINELCEETVRTIDPMPNGVFAVDLKCDKKNNPKVTEINCGRYLSSSLVLFYTTKFNAPHYTFQMALNGKLDQKIKKINPIKSNLIISRQLDEPPVIYAPKDLERLKDIQRKKEFYLVK